MFLVPVEDFGEIFYKAFDNFSDALEYAGKGYERTIIEVEVIIGSFK